MSQADLIIYGTLVVVAVAFGLIVYWAVGVRRRHDAQSRALTADQVRDLTRDDRVGDRFLWCIWQDRLSKSAFRLHVRDERDTELTVATHFFRPRSGVKVRYRLGGQARECVHEGLLSNRTLLVAPGSPRPLAACAHETLCQRLLAGDLETERCRIGPLSLLKETRTLTQGDREIGRLFMVKPLDYHVLVLAVLPGTLTLEEQVFVLVGLRSD